MFVDITDDAECDLEEIGDFIARKGSPKRAETFVEELERACVTLADGPFCFFRSFRATKNTGFGIGCMATTRFSIVSLRSTTGSTCCGFSIAGAIISRSSFRNRLKVFLQVSHECAAVHAVSPRRHKRAQRKRAVHRGGEPRALTILLRACV